MRFLIGLILVSLSAFADDSPLGTNDTVVPLMPPSAESPAVKTPHAGKHSGKLGGEKKAKASASNLLRGHCTLLESPMNPITGPCISVPLELKDEKGVSQGIARTSAQGEFEFDVEAEGPFTLAPSSSYYQLISPTESIHRGDRVNLKIREKN
jgi:hypothetical protein